MLIHLPSYKNIFINFIVTILQCIIFDFRFNSSCCYLNFYLILEIILKKTKNLKNNSNPKTKYVLDVFASLPMFFLCVWLLMRLFKSKLKLLFLKTIKTQEKSKVNKGTKSEKIKVEGLNCF